MTSTMFHQLVRTSSLLRSTGQCSARQTIINFVPKRSNVSVATASNVSEEWETAKPYEDIPGPKPLPLIGNAWIYLPFLGALSMEPVAQNEIFYKTYGSIGKLTGVPGRRDIVVVFDPDDFQKVFRNEGPWPLRDSLPSISYYRNVYRKDVFDDVGGILVKQGEEWQKFRSIVNPILMQPRSTRIYVEPIDTVAGDFISRIRKLRDEKLEMPEDFANELCKWALESIVYIALDKRMGCLADNLRPDSEPQKIINAVQDSFNSTFKLDVKLSPWRIISTPAWRKFVKAADFFNDVCIKYINQALERLKSLPEDSDRELTVLEKLLARDSNPKTAMVMALDMMSAGVETTSFSTAVALYYLAKNPDKQEILFNEMKSLIPEKSNPVTSEMLNEMKYLKACIKESMRLKPIAIGNIRTLVKDIVLSGYRVPKGVDVFMPNIYLCQMEKYFPQPEKYIPERWLKTDDGSRSDSRMTHPFVFLPFGFGPRMCVGRRFAELELETLLAKIIRNFQVEYNYGEMEFKSKILYVPASPLKFKFVDRD